VLLSELVAWHVLRKEVELDARSHLTEVFAERNQAEHRTEVAEIGDVSAPLGWRVRSLRA
jgi:hypothetical protein